MIDRSGSCTSVLSQFLHLLAVRTRPEVHGMNNAPDNKSLRQTLWAIEEQAWQALSAGSAAQFYGRYLAPQAAMVFPSGVLTREQILSSLESAPPWASYRIDDAHVIILTDDSAVLTYTARAQRTGDTPYQARMTTVFVRDPAGGDWMTAFHQQTPIQT